MSFKRHRTLPETVTGLGNLPADFSRQAVRRDSPNMPASTLTSTN